VVLVKKREWSEYWPTSSHGRVEEGEGLKDRGDHVAFLLVEPKQDFHIIVVLSSTHQNLWITGKEGVPRKGSINYGLRKQLVPDIHRHHVGDP